MTPYPLLLEPVLKERGWGGRALLRLGKPLPPEVLIGESWEVADVPEARSIIRNGPLAGRSLQDAIAEDRPNVVGAARVTADGGFPLLIRYLDAHRNLPVQVHPDEAYLTLHPEAHLKSAAWYVIHARPGSVVYKGLKPDVSPERFARDVEEGRGRDDLIAVPSRSGDCHDLPGGICHALGAGNLVAEVQSPAAPTFRLGDEGRSGSGLHVEQALQCINFAQPAPPDPPSPPPPITRGGITTRSLLDTDHFALERIEVRTSEAFPVVTNGLPEAWMILSGRARIQTSGAGSVDVSRGTTVLLPALISDAAAIVDRSATILRITLPSPIRGFLA